MVRYINFIVMFILYLSTFAFSTYNATVINVTDGDSLKVKLNNNLEKKIRLYGIDAPEFLQKDGPLSGRYLASRVGGERVIINEINIDQYGRSVAMVYDLNGVNLNEEMVRFGLAWVSISHYKEGPWIELEKLARENKIGIWKRKTVQAPWDYRKTRKKK